ncbi:MAG TPA: hypothetical protein VHE12_11040 [bacterium]|nr:hypothetical protein [bacterium]
MEIKEKDLGKIVQLPVRPEWGLGIIVQTDRRFAFIFFREVKEKTAKKYFRDENPLVLAPDQAQPDLVRRARLKNKKIKVPRVNPAQA